MKSPFDCGFMIETLDCYAFGKHKDIKLKIFKIPVSKENKEKIEEYIENRSTTRYVVLPFAFCNKSYYKIQGIIFFLISPQFPILSKHTCL